MKIDRHANSFVSLISEVGALAVTLTAIAGFSRVFTGDDWVRPLVIAAVCAHVILAVCRRLGAGLIIAAGVSLIGLVIQVTWTHYRDTTTALFPSGRTREAIDVDISAAWSLFGEVKAPTPAAIGFVVLTTVAVWVVVFLSDWASFRLWSPLESLVPSFSMVVFVAFFGSESDRLLMTALYASAVVVFLLVHNIARQDREVRWLAGASGKGNASLLAAGGVACAIAIVCAVTIGPDLPGADRDPIIDLDDRRTGPSSRVVVSPIVDIRGRLVDQSNVEAFTVRSETPSYWRLASLDSFNGQVWGADTRYGHVSGDLPDDFPVQAQTQVVTQDFAILDMGAVWLPAAYEARAVTSTSVDEISYEPISGTLIVSNDLATSDGLEYSLISELPLYSSEGLASSSGQLPEEVRDRYLELPGDFSESATRIAGEVTQGLASGYDKALALQNYFRDPDLFTYDLNVGQGHSNGHIDTFLATGRGYCEQFAGSYAAMARSIGLPARVAVGFTWGDVDPADPTLYHVRGEHAHAWPEVYIQGAGWVAFEPTPSRGAPGAEAWTNVTPSQAGQGADEPGGAPTPTPDPGSGPSPVFPNDAPQDVAPAIPPTGTDAAPPGAGGDGGLPGWLKTTLVTLGVTIAASAVYAALVVGTQRARAQRAVSSATDNRERVGAVWTNSVAALVPLGVSYSPDETIAEFGSRARAATGEVGEELAGLSELATNAAYGPELPDNEAVAAADAHHDRITEIVKERVRLRRRVKHLLDPRPLLPGR